MKLSECQRSRPFFDLGQRHSDFKVKLVFLKNSWEIGTKAHMKAKGRMRMKIYANELGHMTNMATMPIYGKNLENVLLQKQ